MNEQIEKQLLPYLPYKLKYQKVSSGHFAGEPDRVEIKEWHYNDIQDLFKKRYQVKSVKAILRPMSDLNKEVYQNEILIRWGGGLSDRAKAQWLKEVTDEMLYSAFNSIRYDFVEFMLEHHLDVFNLIPQNLAIDINSLNK